LTVQEHGCYVEAAEIPDDCMVPIGQIPLELLHFVVDTAGQELGGKHWFLALFRSAVVPLGESPEKFFGYPLTKRRRRLSYGLALGRSGLREAGY
jgi:hypothetical protein